LKQLKSVLVFQFSDTETPGYLETFLNEQNISWQLIAVNAGQAVPNFSDKITAIALMGGTMSVNDPLPWIPPMITLIQEAIQAGVPVIGHCLGGQLLAKALGAQIVDCATAEIGWGEVQLAPISTAEDWFGSVKAFEGFHWHFQTFSIPTHAVPIMHSRYCNHQAFVFNDRHIGFQCHIEMTVPMVKQWCGDAEAALNARENIVSVQTKQQMLQDIEVRIAKLNKIAGEVYRHWLSKASLQFQN
jgi:GMP synthase-like glutamine amidotransferase